MDDHLEMMWSSLVQAKEELGNMRQKFHEVQEVNQKMADEVQEINQNMVQCRAEIRDLSLAVKNIELENIGQKKMMEDMARKTAKEIKSVESKVLRYSQERECLEDHWYRQKKSSTTIKSVESKVLRYPQERECLENHWYRQKEELDNMRQKLQELQVFNGLVKTTD